MGKKHMNNTNKVLSNRHVKLGADKYFFTGDRQQVNDAVRDFLQVLRAAPANEASGESGAGALGHAAAELLLRLFGEEQTTNLLTKNVGDHEKTVRLILHALARITRGGRLDSAEAKAVFFAPLPFLEKEKRTRFTVKGRSFFIKRRFSAVIRAGKILLDIGNACISEKKRVRFALKALLTRTSFLKATMISGFDNEMPILSKSLDALREGGFESSEHSENNAVISLDTDARLIYAAFLEAYGMDLSREKNLGWRQFCALIAGLPESSVLRREAARRIESARARPLEQGLDALFDTLAGF